MKTEKTKFALLFGDRGPFSSDVVSEARKELPEILKKLGHETIMTPEDATPNGAIETYKDGKYFANWLLENRGKFDAVIISLPNFGDENGALEGLKNAGVPIFIQAYPDDLDKMDSALRRDSFCGKLSIADVFIQQNVPFTTLKPHVVHPNSDRFKENIAYFDKVCQVVKGLKGMIVGAIGARTTPFKTVRIDELALQKYDITVEPIDLTEIFTRMRSVSADNDAYKDKVEMLKDRASWKGVPDKSFDGQVRLGVVMDDIINEYEMDAIGFRCWVEIQKEFGISPCVTMGDLNQKGIAASCEVDIGNAIMMKALALASGQPACCLDWNNNYGDDDEKCIVFHCGPIPPALMAGKGQIEDHPLIGRVVGMGIGFGCNTGRIIPCGMTFGSLGTVDGKVKTYLGQGKITEDPIPSDFFGCAGVAQIENLDDVLQYICQNGHRHHLSMTSGLICDPVKEAFTKYLGFDVDIPQQCKSIN